MAVLKGVFFLMFVPLILQNSEGFRMGRECSSNSSNRKFYCLSNSSKCVPQSYICDTFSPDCPGGEDEEDCIFDCAGSFTYFTCRSSGRCINKTLLCNGYNDCGDYSDEMCEGYEGYWRWFSTPQTEAPTTTTKRPLVIDVSQWNATKMGLVSWFVGRRRSNGAPMRWGGGDDVPRTAVALFLADKSFFSAGNATGQEIQYALANRLLVLLNMNRKPMNGQEMASYINALLVSCLDPKDFYGRDLVGELRHIVDGGESTKDPFSILALCIAGGTMTTRDVQKVIQIYNATSRPYWTDAQALSVLSFACLSTRTSVDARLLHSMGEELKTKQFLNGTVENTRSTALVVQALTATNNLGPNFNHNKALQSLAVSQRSDGSIGTLLDSYYAIAAFSGTSLLDVSNSHCKLTNIKESPVVHSVWLGNDAVVGRTWRLLAPPSGNCYDILERVNAMDSCYGIRYNVVKGKPFVSSVLGIDDDPEKGLFWFSYIKKEGGKADAIKFTESPADVTLGEKEELILWYRNIRWGSNDTAASDDRQRV